MDKEYLSDYDVDKLKTCSSKSIHALNLRLLQQCWKAM